MRWFLPLVFSLFSCGATPLPEAVLFGVGVASEEARGDLRGMLGHTQFEILPSLEGHCESQALGCNDCGGHIFILALGDQQTCYVASHEILHSFAQQRYGDCDFGHKKFNYYTGYAKCYERYPNA